MKENTQAIMSARAMKNLKGNQAKVMLRELATCSKQRNFKRLKLMVVILRNKETLIVVGKKFRLSLHQHKKL